MILYRIAGVRKLALWVQNFLFNLLYHAKIGNAVRIFGWPIIAIHKGSSIRIGKNAMLISSPFFSEPGVAHPVILRTLSPQAKIVIGENVGMSGGGICAAQEVRIGNNVMLGANAFVSDTDFHPVNPTERRFSTTGTKSEPVVIEDNVFIGMNSLVLKGVTIGANTVVAAGSIVVRSIPANCICGGVPARIIGEVQSP
jgi:acetyltransferase-like isoleucine patch superfamily enzyme